MRLRRTVIIIIAASWHCRGATKVTSPFHRSSFFLRYRRVAVINCGYNTLCFGMTPLRFATTNQLGQWEIVTLHVYSANALTYGYGRECFAVSSRCSVDYKPGCLRSLHYPAPTHQQPTNIWLLCSSNIHDTWWDLYILTINNHGIKIPF